MVQGPGPSGAAAPAPEPPKTAAQLFEADLEKDCLGAGNKAVVVDALGDVLVKAFGLSADEASDLAADNAVNLSGDAGIIDRAEFVQCSLALLDAGKLKGHESTFMPPDPKGRPEREFCEQHAMEVFDEHVQTFLPQTLLQLLEAHRLSPAEAAETAKSFGNMFDSPDPKMTSSDGLISCDEYKKAMLFLFEEESYFPYYHEMAAAAASAAEQKAAPAKKASAAKSSTPPKPAEETVTVSKNAPHTSTPLAPHEAWRAAQKMGLAPRHKQLEQSTQEVDDETVDAIHESFYSDIPIVHYSCAETDDDETEMLMDNFLRFSATDDFVI